MAGETLITSEALNRVYGDFAVPQSLLELFSTAIPEEFNDYQARQIDNARRKEILSMESNFAPSFVDWETMNYLSLVYWGGAGKEIFDRQIQELVWPGIDGSPKFNIPERMVHETMAGPIAAAAAGDLDMTLRDLRLGGNIIELNTGLGSWLYAMKRQGLQVLASVEKNSELQGFMKQIWEGLRLPLNGTELINGDAWEVVDSRVENKSFRGKPVHAITADPPWSRYISNGEMFDFSVMRPDGRLIVPHLMEKHADVVAVKLPGRIKEDAVKELARENGMGYRLFIYETQVGRRRMEEAMGVFINGSIVGSIREQVTRKRV